MTDGSACRGMNVNPEVLKKEASLAATAFSLADVKHFDLADHGSSIVLNTAEACWEGEKAERSIHALASSLLCSLLTRPLLY